jgi:hypothetical protein
VIYYDKGTQVSKTTGFDTLREEILSSSASIAAFPRLPMLLRSQESSHEEERPEHETDYDRDGAVVSHPCLQRPEHGRGSVRKGRVEADERKNRDNEDYEHQHERHDAALRAEA